jgi:tetratricopeptide (TPR) repeat protein
VSALLALLVVGIASWRREARAIVRTLVRGDEAAALYRQGRAFWRQRTPRGFDQARLTFEAAIAADPGHSQAHAGLADTYSLLEAFGLMAAADALPMARREAERAVQLDPNLGEAHASLAFVLWELHDTTAAVDEMERALELDPDYATAHHWYGLFLQQFLRRHEAIAEVRRAVALDPSQPVFWTELASMLKFARRFDEAEAVLHDAQRRHPGFPEVYVLLSDLALERKDAARSVALLRRAVALGDNRPRIVARLGCLEGTTGNLSATADALHLLRELDASGQHVPGDAFAVLLALTGDLDGAFHHIQRGLNQREDWVSGVADTAGCFAPVQADARWPALRTALEQAQWLLPGSRVPALDSQVAPAPTRMINEGS